MKGSKDALKVGAELLGVRDYSREEMTARLIRRGVAPEERRPAAERLAELGLIKIRAAGREELAAAAREYLEKKGKELKPSTLAGLAAYLSRKGFPEELIEEYLNEAAEVMRGLSHEED